MEWNGLEYLLLEDYDDDEQRWVPLCCPWRISNEEKSCPDETNALIMDYDCKP